MIPLISVIYGEILSYIEFERLLPLRLTSKLFNQLIIPKIWYTFSFLGKDIAQVEHYLIKYGSNINIFIISYIPFQIIENYIKYFVALEKVIIESNNKELTHGILSSFLVHKPNLKCVYINSIVMDFIDLDILRQFYQLDNFIIQNTTLKEVQTSAIIESISNHNLKKLKLIVGSIELQSIYQIADKFPDLRSFYLKGSLTSPNVCDTFILPKFANLLQLSLIIKESCSDNIKLDETHFEKLKELRLVQERCIKLSFKIVGIFRNVIKVNLEWFEDDFSSLNNKLPNVESIVLNNSLKWEIVESTQSEFGYQTRDLTEPLNKFSKLKSLCICSEFPGHETMVCKSIPAFEYLKFKNIKLGLSLLDYLQLKGQNIRKLALVKCKFTTNLIESLKKDNRPFVLDNLTWLEFDCDSPVLFNAFTNICPNLNVNSKLILNNLSSYYCEIGAEGWNQIVN